MEMVVRTESRLVPRAQGGITLGMTNRSITSELYDQIKKQQRSAQNYWLSSWAYPTGDIYAREALEAGRELICYGMLGSRVGDCCSRMNTHDIHELRRRTASRATAA